MQLPLEQETTKGLPGLTNALPQELLPLLRVPDPSRASGGLELSTVLQIPAVL